MIFLHKTLLVSHMHALTETTKENLHYHFYFYLNDQLLFVLDSYQLINEFLITKNKVAQHEENWGTYSNTSAFWLNKGWTSFCIRELNKIAWEEAAYYHDMTHKYRFYWADCIN